MKYFALRCHYLATFVNRVPGKETSVVLCVICLVVTVFNSPGFENARGSPAYVDI